MTVPEVFLKTVAAKLCVTPTRLVPSTSTIRSFTWILNTNQRGQAHPPVCVCVCVCGVFNFLQFTVYR